MKENGKWVQRSSAQLCLLCVCVCVCVALISGMCSVFVLYQGFRCTTHVSTAVLTGIPFETE